MRQSELDAWRQKRNADLLNLFQNGVTVSALCSIYTLHENVVCSIIRAHMEAERQVIAEFGRDKKKSKLGKGTK